MYIKLFIIVYVSLKRFWDESARLSDMHWSKALSLMSESLFVILYYWGISFRKITKDFTKCCRSLKSIIKQHTGSPKLNFTFESNRRQLNKQLKTFPINWLLTLFPFNKSNFIYKYTFGLVATFLETDTLIHAIQTNLIECNSNIILLRKILQQNSSFN